MNPPNNPKDSKQTVAINFADIVEDNGKTIRENNIEKIHDISIGTLVEVKFNQWHGDGACEKTHARLWVVGHNRDCDGTPLYSLSRYREPMFVDGTLRYRGDDGWWIKKEIVLNIANEVHTGFSRESLTVVEITPELIAGQGSLFWGDDEK
jgi:hypothetical protein